MRLNGFVPSSYPLDRAAQRSSAPVPYRDSQKVLEQPGEAVAVPANPTYEHLAKHSGEAVGAVPAMSNDFLPARFEATMERPLTNRAAHALASYSSTASFGGDIDAHEVLGLDLYA